MKFPVKTTEKRLTGNLGEALVAKYLTKQGFIVLSRNYLLAYGELDLVAKKAGVIHFVEVKSVTCEIPPDVSREMSIIKNPAEKIDEHKLRKIGKAAQTYLVNMDLLDMDWQVDAALVWIDRASKRAKVELLENVSAGI